MEHHGSFADDDAGAVIEHDAAPQPRRRMDVDTEKLRDAALKKQRHPFAVLVPEPVRDAKRFQRLKALVVEKGLQIGVAGRVALEHSRKIGAHSRSDGHIARQRLFEGFAGQQRGDIVIAELLGEVEAERILQSGMLQDRGMDESRQRGFRFGHAFGFGTHGVPTRVAGVDFLAGIGHGVSFGMVLLSQMAIEFQNSREFLVCRSS